MPYVCSFIIDERVGETAEERNFEMIKILHISVSVHSQEADQDQVNGKEEPGEKLRPCQDQVQNENGREQHARLPCMKSHIVTLVLQDEQ